MRDYFFWGLAVFIPTAIVAAFVWAVARALWSVYSDWRLGHELDQLSKESASRREQRGEVNERRLASGCDHDFTTGAFGLPPNACCKCGLERDKPPGPCDHIWRTTPGPRPVSTCDKCGKTYAEAGQP